MKKLFTLLILLCAVVTASADDLTTVYLKPGTNWKQANARFALYMFKNGGASAWVDFNQISDGLYYALFNKTQYDQMILCRMNPNASENNWDNKWNQSADLSAPSSSAPVYIVGNGDWDGISYTGVSIENSGCTIHKIYVQDKEATGQVPYFYEYQNATWFSIDNTWPGAALTTEIVGGKTWYVFKTLKTTVLGRFMQNWNNESNWAAGGIEFNLSSGDVYYNYYPSVYQSILASEALATPAVLHFRSNNGASTLKHYFWNSSGINDEGFTTTSAGGATDWVTITTYKPSFSIQFYTYDNGGTNTDKSDGIDITGLTGGENYYYFAKLNANNATGDYEFDGKGIMKMQDSYYLVYADGWDFDSGKDTYSGSGVKQTVGAVQLTANSENNFLFEGTLDNTNGKKIYYAIVPASDWSGTAITEWNNLISPSHPEMTDSKYTIDAFEIDECDAMPTTWGRWYNSGVNTKLDIAFNFATMKWTSTPFIEKTLATAAEGYATFSSAYNVAIPDGITAKYATGVTNGAIDWSDPLTNGIPKNTGVLLIGTAGEEYTFTPATSDVVAPGTNYLKAISTKTKVAQTEGGATRYILARPADNLTSGTIAFYKVNENGSWCAAGTAYLEVPGEDVITAPAFISLDGETTAIDAIDFDEQTSKEANATIFDLSGRKVNANDLPKGIYVKNGKKFIIK